jgi:hypothetical protein
MADVERKDKTMLDGNTVESEERKHCGLMDTNVTIQGCGDIKAFGLKEGYPLDRCKVCEGWGCFVPRPDDVEQGNTKQDHAKE